MPNNTMTHYRKITGGNDDIMHNLCKGGQVFNPNRHTWALFYADMEDNVHMLMEVTIAELVVKLDPSLYRKHNQKRKPMLDVQLIKAL